jgi:hypothetical protein
MGSPKNAIWAITTNGGSANLDAVTRGSGTTAERTAILRGWPLNRPFFDTDLDCHFYNAGTLDSVSWKVMLFPVASSLPVSPTDRQLCLLPLSLWGLCEYDATEGKWWSITKEMWTPDIYDDLSTDTSQWITTDSSKISVNTALKRIDFLINAVDSGNDSISRPLGLTASDTKWTLEFEVCFTQQQMTAGATRRIFIGLCDLPSSTAFNSNQDSCGIVFRLDQNAGSPQPLIGADSNGSAITNNSTIQNPTFPLIAHSIFVRIARRSSTVYSVHAFMDSAMTIRYSDFSVGYLTNNLVISASTVSLDELCVKMEPSASTQNATGWVRNFKFWNGADRNTYNGSI